MANIKIGYDFEHDLKRCVYFFDKEKGIITDGVIESIYFTTFIEQKVDGFFCLQSRTAYDIQSDFGFHENIPEEYTSRDKKKKETWIKEK